MIPQREKEALISIALNSGAGRITVSGPTDPAGEFFGDLLDSLARRGYLYGEKRTGYWLTPLGETALADLLEEDEARTKTASRLLNQLGRECIDKLDKLQVPA